MSLLDCLYERVWDTDLKSYPRDVVNFFNRLQNSLTVEKQKLESEPFYNVEHFGVYLFRISLRDTKCDSFLGNRDLLKLINDNLYLECVIDEFYEYFTVYTKPYILDFEDSDISLERAKADMIHICFELSLIELDSFMPSLLDWHKSFDHELLVAGHM